MFGCCKYAMSREYFVDFDDTPNLEQLKADYGDEITLGKRPNQRNPEYRPEKWVLVTPDKEIDVCTCACHVRNGPAIMC